ncbi:AraC family transcriptional regulator [Ruminiclostridium papyrosolvens]|uniref:DNA gyrase inhibitor n=1 Tax=Ruminiclostridium papyrosolvens C7 TaxID=1330534 RepID=U4R668_9FIRM|nr:GyrI-like domain-containing protein [Ruminiclostridium papyrosolvens]EPR13417.1 DNA gyrase inhibitor [Ruminiclostridium papyrosolvens C7]
MNMNIETIPAGSIAYIRQIGAYGAENIRTMEQLKRWAETSNLMNNKTVIFGIAHDNPKTTPPENCRYDACILLADKRFPTDGNIKHGEISGGKHAVFTVKHTAKAVEQAWGNIFPALFESGFLYDATRPILERYTAKKVEQHLCEICVPIS